MQLVIAEKPSVAQSIAKVIGAYKREDGYLEGSGYIVSWCVGHLVELAQPQDYDEKYARWRIEDLPIMPQEWSYSISEGTAKQFRVLKKLMERSDVTELIEATDAGREGELIFRLVYHQTGCKKPFKRLWISSMEDNAIKAGFQNLRPSFEYDRLYAAALARSQADWLVGINGTRLFTKLYDKKLTVGRVQTPTLTMVVDRQKQIDGFQKQKYWNVHLMLDGADLVKEKHFDKAEAERIAEECRQHKAIITKAQSTEKAVSAPRLYDLTTLQREANRYFGYTAQKTLDYTQSLYEQKLVTYPRTDSQFLSDDMSSTAEQMVQLVKQLYGVKAIAPHKPDISRILNSSKVSDHHAIIPTAEIEKQELSRLAQGERDILLLISMRLLAATDAKQRVQETELTADCSGYEFKAKGKNVLDPGWKIYEDMLRDMIGGKKTEAEKMLPALVEGQSFENPETSVTEHQTSPPKAYTEDTLLSALETAGNDCFDEDTEKKGLGTPATRAAMIEKLVANQYIRRKGKQLVPTEDGLAMAELLPEEIKSPKLTADWENALMQIEHGEAYSEAFMADIGGLVRTLVSKYGTAGRVENNPFSDITRPQREQIGVCPRCGSPVYEGEKNYYCSAQGCSFCIWKESRWLSGMKKKITKKMATTLLKDGRVYVTGFYSERKGRCFDAFLVLDDTGKQVNFKLDFDGKKAARNKKKG